MPRLPRHQVECAQLTSTSSLLVPASTEKVAQPEDLSSSSLTKGRVVICFIVLSRKFGPGHAFGRRPVSMTMRAAMSAQRRSSKNHSGNVSSVFEAFLLHVAKISYVTGQTLLASPLFQGTRSFATQENLTKPKSSAGSSLVSFHPFLFSLFKNLPIRGALKI